MSTHNLAGAALLLIAVATLVGCPGSTDPDHGAACHAGDAVICACPGGNGLTRCVDGTYGACDCSVVEPTDAGFDEDGD